MLSKSIKISLMPVLCMGVSAFLATDAFAATNVTVLVELTQPGNNEDGSPNTDDWFCSPAGTTKGPFPYPADNNTDVTETADAAAADKCEEENPGQTCTASAISPQKVHATCLGNSDPATISPAYTCTCTNPEPPEPVDGGGDSEEVSSDFDTEIGLILELGR